MYWTKHVDYEAAREEKQRQLRFRDVEKSWCDKGKCQGEMVLCKQPKEEEEEAVRMWQ